jgi:hypothetical protein
MTERLNYFVRFPKWLIPRWWEVAYLIIGPGGWRNVDLVRIIETAPDERFNELVTEHVNAYIQDGKMPPTEIAPAIMNLADDLMAGRKMSMRAGDYISLQQFARQNKAQ